MLGKAAARAGPRTEAEEQSRLHSPGWEAGGSDDHMDTAEGAGATGLHL